MLVAEVISPKPNSKAKISCNGCDLQYSHKDYEVLLNSKKLAYFDIVHAYYDIEVNGADCICHDCLFKLLKVIGEHIAEGEEVKMKLTHKGAEYYMNYDPEDPSSLW
jgi:fructose-1,6-bisphosphatase